MKLLSFLAAALLSLSAFSQDLVQYNEGTFSRNGEDLSLEQVEQLIEEYQAGGQAQVNFMNGVLFNKRAEQRILTRIFRAYVLGGLGLGAAICIRGVGWMVEDPYDLWPHENPELARVIYFTGNTVGVTSVSYAVVTSTSKYWQNRRDNVFGQLTEQLNSSISRKVYNAE